MTESDQPGAIGGPFQQIKLAPGVLGYTMYVAGLVIILLIVVTIARPDLAPWTLGLSGLVLLGFIWFAAWFGSKFPGPALLGGAHLVQNLESVAAQGRVVAVDGIPVQNPALDAPPRKPPAGSDDAA